MKWSRRGLRSVAAVALATAVAGAGCGSQGDAGGPQVTLLITRDFGGEVLAEERLPLRGHETLGRLLDESHEVEYGEFGEIRSVDGLEGEFDATVDLTGQASWRHYVDGLKIHAAPKGLPLFPGDVAQVDLAEVEALEDLKAGVGAFPQPFTGSLLGRRVRVTVSCAGGVERACRHVRRTLKALGVDPSGRPPRQPRPTARVRRARNRQPEIRRVEVLVGPWRDIEGRLRPRLRSGDAEASGLFVRFDDTGTEVSPLDWNYRPAGTFGAGSGVLAATRPTVNGLLWLVTGTDARGVDRAALALDPEKLRGAFGWVLTADESRRIPASPSD